MGLLRRFRRPIDVILDRIYGETMNAKRIDEPEPEGEEPVRKPLVWLHGEIKTPLFSSEARLEGGTLLRRIQEGGASDSSGGNPWR